MGMEPSSASRLAQEEAERTQWEIAEKHQRALQFKVAVRERLATHALQEADAPAPAPETNVLVATRKAEMQRDRMKASARASKERHAKLDRRRQARVRGVARSADVQRLHDLAREQNERQAAEQRLLEAELRQRAEAQLEARRDKVAAKRSTTGAFAPGCAHGRRA